MDFITNPPNQDFVLESQQLGVYAPQPVFANSSRGTTEARTRKITPQAVHESPLCSSRHADVHRATDTRKKKRAEAAVPRSVERVCLPHEFGGRSSGLGVNPGM